MRDWTHVRGEHVGCLDAHVVKSRADGSGADGASIAASHGD